MFSYLNFDLYIYRGSLKYCFKTGLNNISFILHHYFFCSSHYSSGYSFYMYLYNTNIHVKMLGTAGVMLPSISQSSHSYYKTKNRLMSQVSFTIGLKSPVQ